MKVELKGDTPEKKFKHLERIIQRMSRRLQKTVIGLLPVAPILGHVNDPVNDPCVLSIIFPANGTITHAALRAQNASKGTKLVIELTSGSEVISKTFTLKNVSVVEEVHYEIKAGDILEAFVETTEEGSGQVWLGILYQIAMKDSVVTPIAVEQFEQLTGDFDAGED